MYGLHGLYGEDGTVPLYVSMYACMHACMDVCMCVHMCTMFVGACDMRIRKAITSSCYLLVPPRYEATKVSGIWENAASLQRALKHACS